MTSANTEHNQSNAQLLPVSNGPLTDSYIIIQIFLKLFHYFNESTVNLMLFFCSPTSFAARSSFWLGFNFFTLPSLQSTFFVEDHRRIVFSSYVDVFRNVFHFSLISQFNDLKCHLTLFCVCHLSFWVHMIEISYIIYLRFLKQAFLALSISFRFSSLLYFIIRTI